MNSKLEEKNKAIELRREGLSYREILRRIPVAKSSLSLWLHSVGLSKSQKQRLTEKKLAAMKRGWLKVHTLRLQRIEEVKTCAKNEVLEYLKDPLWLIGTVLYWGEGSKMKEWRRGEQVKFTSMDPKMILIFIDWLKHYFKLQTKDLLYSLYVHKTALDRIEKIKRYWSKILAIPETNLKIYFKNSRRSTKRKNTGITYYGVLRVTARKSASMNHRITGWIEGLQEKYCGVV